MHEITAEVGFLSEVLNLTPVAVTSVYFHLAMAAAVSGPGVAIDAAHAAADVLTLSTQGRYEVNFFLQNDASYFDSCCDVERRKQLAQLPGWVRSKEDRMRTALAFTPTIATLILTQVTAASGRPSRSNLFSIRGGDSEQEDRASTLRSVIYAARCPSVRAFVTCLLRAHPAWCQRFAEAITAVFNAEPKTAALLEPEAIERLVKAYRLREGCPLLVERSLLETAAANAAAGGAEDPEEDEAEEDSTDDGFGSNDDGSGDDSDDSSCDEDMSSVVSFASAADAVAAAEAAARKAESQAAKATAAAHAATTAAAQARAAATAAALASAGPAGTAAPAAMAAATAVATAAAAAAAGPDDPRPPYASQGASQPPATGKQ